MDFDGKRYIEISEFGKSKEGSLGINFTWSGNPLTVGQMLSHNINVLLSGIQPVLGKKCNVALQVNYTLVDDGITASTNMSPRDEQNKDSGGIARKIDIEIHSQSRYELKPGTTPTQGKVDKMKVYGPGPEDISIKENNNGLIMWGLDFKTGDVLMQPDNCIFDGEKYAFWCCPSDLIIY